MSARWQGQLNRIQHVFNLINLKHLLFRSLASGSSTLIAITFQSVSPSSIMARTPSTFTLMTSPREYTYRWWFGLWGLHKSFFFTTYWSKLTLVPISQTSMGSLSPQQPVSPSLCAGSSHVWNNNSQLHNPSCCLRLKNDRFQCNISAFYWPEEWLHSSICSLYVEKHWQHNATCPSSHLALLDLGCL